MTQSPSAMGGAEELEVTARRGGYAGVEVM